MIITGSPYGSRMTCLRLRSSLRFLKTKCKSAYYYKIVEATEIVGSRRIVEIKYDHPAKTVRKCKRMASYDHRKLIVDQCNLCKSLFRHFMIIKCGGVNLSSGQKMLNGILINR